MAYTPKDPTVKRLLDNARRAAKARRKPAKRKASKRREPAKRKAAKRKTPKRKASASRSTAATMRARLARLYKARKLGEASKLRAKMRKKGFKV